MYRNRECGVEIKTRSAINTLRGFIQSGFGSSPRPQLTMEGISQIRSDTFTMSEVFAACAPLAAPRFPENRHVREKLRQQMQRLRDLGLVLFLGGGRYERLARQT